MYKVGLGIILFLYTIGTASCSKILSANMGDPLELQSTAVVKAEDISEITYFHGGWFGPAGMPNWSHDMRFTFNTDGSVGISAKIPEDVYCGKSGSFTAEQKDTFVKLINKMKIGPMMFGAVDGGVNLLTIKTKKAEDIKIYLPQSDFIGEDQLYALEGGEAVRDRLAEIYALELAMFCQ